ncbi:hypothetical protein NHX12_014869 [Muraenolepis orangiensis]|uniref:Transmembrane protein 198 n=1 Tax=Muraenolepis orangiensis TaxID=630683 RepID=A0A9Q0D8V4_9TELE|nr:hypothetical protein NHX12_014869 [Muraenolepis orangiensis]
MTTVTETLTPWAGLTQAATPAGEAELLRPEPLDGCVAPGGRHKVVPSVVCSMCCLFGIVYCFFGYRCFKAVMFLTGLMFGSVVVFLLCHRERVLDTQLSAEASMGVGLGVGVLCGLVTMLVRSVGLFMTGLLLGLLVAVATLVCMEELSSSPPRSVWAPLGVLLGLGTLFAVLTLQWQRLFTTLSTACFGAAAMAVALDYFAELLGLVLYVYERLKATPRAKPVCWVTWAVLGAWAALALLGVLVQWKVTAEGYSHTKVIISHQQRHMQSYIQNFRERQVEVDVCADDPQSSSSGLHDVPLLGSGPLHPRPMSSGPLNSRPISSVPLLPRPMSSGPPHPRPMSSGGPLNPRPMSSSGGPLNPRPMSSVLLGARPMSSSGGPLNPRPMSSGGPLNPRPMSSVLLGARPTSSGSPHNVPLLSNSGGPPNPRPMSSVGPYNSRPTSSSSGGGPHNPRPMSSAGGPHNLTPSNSTGGGPHSARPMSSVGPFNSRPTSSSSGSSGPHSSRPMSSTGGPHNLTPSNSTGGGPHSSRPMSSGGGGPHNPRPTSSVAGPHSSRPTSSSGGGGGPHFARPASGVIVAGGGPHAVVDLGLDGACGGSTSSTTLAPPPAEAVGPLLRI